MDIETTQEFALEDRLNAVLYQFVKLYERWSEDRQLSTKQLADIAELMTLFGDQVSRFKRLEPEVRQQLMVSIQQAISSALDKLGAEIGKEATHAVEQVVQHLAEVTRKTEKTLSRYENEILTTQWKTIGIFVVGTILFALLMVWWLIPQPTLPLSNQQVKLLNSGIMMAWVWPKLSKKEQEHWSQLANQAGRPQLFPEE